MDQLVKYNHDTSFKQKQHKISTGTKFTVNLFLVDKQAIFLRGYPLSQVHDSSSVTSLENSGMRQPLSGPQQLTGMCTLPLFLQQELAWATLVFVLLCYVCMYSWFLLVMDVTFYKVTVNAELGNTEQCSQGKHRVRFLPTSGPIFIC